jgi:DNA mismatch endonuclease Vsr
MNPQKNKNMQAVKSAGSQIERLLGKALWGAGLRYRKNDRRVFGRPDFTLSKYKIAIFADSEFWHGKDWDTRKHDHKRNIAFWHQKIEKNIERDRLVNQELSREGWIVLRFWGREIEENVSACVAKVLATVEHVRSNMHLL